MGDGGNVSAWRGFRDQPFPPFLPPDCRLLNCCNHLSCSPSNWGLGAIVAPPYASAAAAVLANCRLHTAWSSSWRAKASSRRQRSPDLSRRSRSCDDWKALWRNPRPGFRSACQWPPRFVPGRLLLLVFGRLQHLATAILMQFLSVFLVWILAERLGLSGIITIVCMRSWAERENPQDSRTTNVQSRRMSRLGISGDAIRSNIAATAATPISRQGWCTVVRGTVKRLAYWTSSMPTIRTSSGIR